MGYKLSVKKSSEPSIYAVKTTAGQEKNAAEMIITRVKANSLDVSSIDRKSVV